jgi:hypothetical protein
MNYYSYNGRLCFYRTDNIKIKVEIPTSLDNNSTKYPILNYFNQKIIYQVSVKKFEVYSEKDVEENKKQLNKKRIKKNQLMQIFMKINIIN